MLYQAFSVAVFSALLLYASWWDIRHRIIPDGAVFGLMAMGLWRYMQTGMQNWPDLLITTGLVFIIFIVTEAIWRKRHVDVLGLGDIKLMLGIGWVVGVTGLWTTIFSASLGGIAWKLARLFTRKESLETPMPFGPFLGLGAFLAYVFETLG